MLKRKIQTIVNEYIDINSDKVLILDGARQVGKSYIIRHVCKQKFTHFFEVNFYEDKIGEKLFADVKGVEDFYMRLSSVAGRKLGDRDDTMVFLDEIQAYPELLTLLKFLVDDNRYRYIASGSLLGVTLNKTLSKPGGRIDVQQMYPLDFEEFLWANGIGDDLIGTMRDLFARNEALPEALHNRILDLFKTYLLVGGMPDAVNTYLAKQNIHAVRRVHNSIYNLYREDASQYGGENRLKIRAVYDLVPSNMENRKNRLFFNDIEGKRGKTASDYEGEVEYLTCAGIVAEVRAIANPVFPLIASARKSLIKLYMNDVGLLSFLFFRDNVMAVKGDQLSVNLGALYETVSATELMAHGHKLFYYDNKQKGEVDFLVDDYDSLSVLPLEIKSGKDYQTHRALTRFVENPDYGIRRTVVFSNAYGIRQEGNIWYHPIYNIMFV